MTPYTYLFIREDLPHTQQIIQSAHSALEAGREFPEHHGTSHLVLLPAEDETTLLSISLYLTNEGIRHHIFYEPDFNYGYTSITTEPIYGAGRKALAHFKLKGKL